MLIIDAYEDIAYNALQWGRDIRFSAYTHGSVKRNSGRTQKGWLLEI